MGLLKKFKKAVKKVTKAVSKVAGNKVVKTLFPTFSLANSETGQAVGAGLAGGLALSSLGGLFGSFGSGSAGAATAANGVSTGALQGPTLSGATLDTVANVGNGSTGFFGSLLNGIGSSLGNAAIGLGTNYLTSTYNNKLQQGFNDDAFQKNLLLWNMQNEYNKPINQMKRLEEAGLNPNLMYSAGNVGNAGAVGSQYEPVKNSDMDMNSIMAFQNMANLDAQHELLAQQIELAKLQATGRAIENSFIPEKETQNIIGKKLDNQSQAIYNKRNGAITDKIVSGSNLLNDISSAIGNSSFWDKLGEWAYNHSWSKWRLHNDGPKGEYDLF